MMHINGKARSFLVGFTILLLLMECGERSWASPHYSGLLQEAMAHRGFGTTADIVWRFQQAADHAETDSQRGAALVFLAKELMAREEWKMAIKAFDAVLEGKINASLPDALFGTAQACTTLGYPDEGRKFITFLENRFPKPIITATVSDMKYLVPEGVHQAVMKNFTARDLDRELPESVSSSRLSHPGPAGAFPYGRGVVGPMPGAVILPPPVKAFPFDQFFPGENPRNTLAIGLEVWQTGMQGSIAAKGMDLDLHGDAEFALRTVPTLCMRWDFSRTGQLRFDYHGITHDGTLRRPISFDNLQYDPGTTIDLETRFFDVGLAHTVGSYPQGSWKVLGGLKFSHSLLRLSQQLPAGPRVGELDQSFTVPYLGLEGQANVSKNIGMNGSAKFLSLTRRGSRARMSDVAVAFLCGPDYHTTPAEFEWYGTFGYRYFQIDGTAGDDTGNLRSSGPTIGLLSKF